MIAQEVNASEPDEYAVLRKQMVDTQLRTRDISDEKVLAVMEKVPRHRLMYAFIDQAYEDHPVPIGYGQTISQPYIVALMTQELRVNSSDKVLEIGTGSGYQASVLAELVKNVYTIEIIEPLAIRANQTLKDLGYSNVEVMHADGYFGWEEKAPFDAIIITAAANHVPPPLIEQLKDGGRLIIPLASTTGFQTLILITKRGDELETRFITGVRFVPMTGEAQKKS
ncbi:protein-L-isoaspartate(D-aspartate) O-methyltransferase [Candidatus Woesearchaeota archaeon]|nr:protein-L-isoaspartate(D-aspartate) O-methyltransferase [Candidatus Woesearchaeota archaeon]